MNYKETVDYLYQVTPCFQNQGGDAYKPGLERMQQMCEAIGNPQRYIRTIHVGGTNGKGSTTSLIASVLTAAGYKVGLFTSPHLVDFRERIRINGEMISEEEVVSFVERTRPLIESVSPSFFEYTTLMAFEHFHTHEVDYAVIEVGLGGRLDSTNVIQPKLSIITNISLDHTQYLGNTLEAIASEKAGIIKEGVQAVIGNAGGSVRELFERVADERHAPITFCEDEHTIKQYDELHPGMRLDTVDYGLLETPLSGDAQLENVHTVLTALRILDDKVLDTPLTHEEVARGFAELYKLSGLRGRWETISTDPRIVCDTAHNPAGIAVVAHQLEEESYDHLYIIVGMSADKDIDTNLALLPSSARYYFCTTASQRTLPAEELQQRAEAIGLRGRAYPSVEEALREVVALANAGDLIFVGGSNFIVAELLKSYPTIQKERPAHQ
ncbi:MAG: folylpolyglutamate synthase/dihydrofolate synthase family protein [Porphyromonas sp.]|uniref:bifunctional folylpolyglutamate synthase/dihydrofolate synthase n=1 Tax=Porphyromonas sp. TaxID=1924944 RepID=UPI002A75D441|nr:folylpolyglutamate synthase/dihydrofolate synthase family protein [Porphyromonas sp.]MDD6928703.1 bifunctional folylpolyglutamate synthase/dihydrofolate synthase [Bacteroidales bacterium]MDY3112338.1 folylpolyglutamate synthase/dihydrofolate synthase family protein [Porphyromonas sp.]MDY4246105.1 folylpolyglutamate synthase/dihydrofolate synthase family protein [Porphyromonas sp.]